MSATTVPPLTSPALRESSAPVRREPPPQGRSSEKASFRETLAEYDARPDASEGRKTGGNGAAKGESGGKSQARKPATEGPDAGAAEPKQETAQRQEQTGEAKGETQGTGEPQAANQGERSGQATSAGSAQAAQHAATAAQALQAVQVPGEGESGQVQRQTSTSPAPQQVQPIPVQSGDPAPQPAEESATRANMQPIEHSQARPVNVQPVSNQSETSRGASEQGAVVEQVGSRPVKTSGDEMQGRSPQTPTAGSSGRLSSGVELPQAVTPTREVATGEVEVKDSVGRQQLAQKAEAAASMPKLTPAAARAVQVEMAVQLQNLAAQLATADAEAGGSPSPVRIIDPMAATTGSLNAETVQQLLTPETQGEDDAEFANRIVRGLNTMINQRGGVMNMRLHPPELGQLKVQMSIVQGAVNAQFTVSTEHAQAILDRNLTVLRASLQSHGLTVERLAVHLAPPAEQHGATGRQDGGEPQPQSQQESRQDAAGRESRGKHDGERHGDRASHQAGERFAADFGLFADAAFTSPTMAGVETS